MSASRRDLEDAARERFIFGAATYCDIEGCDRPGAAHDLQGGDVCLLHLLERIGLIGSFPARTSVPREVVPRRTCELCDQIATHQIVLDIRSWWLESRTGGGSQHEWPVCNDHVGALPVFFQNGNVVTVELRASVQRTDTE